MRKILSILPIIILLSSNLNAQKLGIRAGINLTNMIIEQNESVMGNRPNSKMGAHFEVLGYVPFHSLWALESAIGISSKGYIIRLAENKKQSDYPYDIFGKRNLTYLEIPLRVKIQKKWGDVDCFAAVGPQMSIGIHGKWNTEKILENKSTIVVRQTKWNDTRDVNSLKRVDFGLFAGLGFAYKSLMVEFSYSGSFNNISAFDGVTAKNKVFSLSVGRYFEKSIHPKPKVETGHIK